MYAKFFGLRELPFNNTPDPRFFYSTSDHEEALASLIYTVRERKGFVLLTGEVGAGKTLVSRMMLRHFGAHIAFANVHHAVRGAADLVESLCTEFELLVENGTSHSRCIRALHDFLLAQFSQDKPVVLVLDEAQALSAETFEQLRMIGNLEADDARLLQVVILGQPELQRRFASPEFHQLRQRVFRIFHLPALSRKVTEDYIRHRLVVAGAPSGDIFDRAAIDVIYQRSQGLPRLINTICDNTMLSAYSADRTRIDGQFVESIIKQLMSLGEDGAGCAAGAETSATSSAGYPSMTATPRGSANAEQDQSPRPPISHEVVGALATRIAELESRLRETQSVGVSDTAGSGRAVSSIPSEHIQADVDRIERELSAKVDEVGRCLAELDRKATRTAALLREAREARAVIEPVVQDAREVVARVKDGCRAVSQQETQVYRTAIKVKAAVEETRCIYDGLRRASGKTQRIERRAHKIHDRLVVQTERSRELAGELARRVEQVAASNRADSARLSTSGAKSVVDAESGIIYLPVTGASNRLQQILSESRERLSDLRILVGRVGDRHAATSKTLSSGVSVRGGDRSGDPTARLTQQVAGLLDIVKSGQTTPAMTATPS